MLWFMFHLNKGRNLIFICSFCQSQVVRDTSNSIGGKSTIYVTSDADNLVYAYSENEASTHLNNYTFYWVLKKENQLLSVSRETSKNLRTSSEGRYDRDWNPPH